VLSGSGTKKTAERVAQHAADEGGGREKRRSLRKCGLKSNEDGSNSLTMLKQTKKNGGKRRDTAEGGERRTVLGGYAKSRSCRNRTRTNVDLSENIPREGRQKNIKKGPQKFLSREKKEEGRLP